MDRPCPRQTGSYPDDKSRPTGDTLSSAPRQSHSRELGAHRRDYAQETLHLPSCYHPPKIMRSARFSDKVPDSVDHKPKQLPDGARR